MVSILKFPACRETVTVLRVLLDRAMEGELRGSALCVWTPQSGDEVVFTGRYKDRPELAIGAALRMNWIATQRMLPPAPTPPPMP